MKAQIENIYDKNRTPLHKAVPLGTPYTVGIEPTTYCNLKCKFCLHSFSHKDMLESEHVFENMSDETFGCTLAQLKEFPKKVKSITFAGVGEPLLHKDLPQMIERLKASGAVERISIITNGVELTHALSQDLVDAGLDNIKISLNGMSGQAYQRNCGSKVNFDKLHSEIAFLYENKRRMEISIKVLDTCLEAGEEDTFYETFGNYCDKISVEKTVALYEELSYEKIISGEASLSRYELNRKNRIKICPSPFFRMSVRSTGGITICCQYNGLPLGEMNVHNTSLKEAWNGEMHRQILLNVLDEKTEGLTKKCAKCALKNDFAFEQDLLDDYEQEIRDRVQMK